NKDGVFSVHGSAFGLHRSLRFPCTVSVFRLRVRVLFDYKPSGRDGRRRARQSLARADVYARGATAARRLQKSAGEETTRRARESRVGSKLMEENLGS